MAVMVSDFLVNFILFSCIFKELTRVVAVRNVWSDRVYLFLIQML